MKTSRLQQVMFPLLLTVLIVSLLLGISFGGVKISPAQISLILLHKLPVLNAFIHPGWLDVNETIVLVLRLPRVLLAGLVGAGLALAGAAFQGLYRNPMADPYVIGVSSGAAFGAVLAMLLLTVIDAMIPLMVPLFASLFAMLTILSVYRLARTGSRVPVINLLLSGVAVSSFLSALVSLIMFFSGSQLHQVVFWLMGGFSGRGWNYVYMFLPWGVIGAGVIFYYQRELNAMLLGEETAQHLGIEVESVKRRLLIAASLLTGAAVSVSGLIGFIGLIIPHMVRILVGPDHRLLLPSSALAGAAVLILSDLLARVVLSPVELPVGIVTALIGAPFFIYLLYKHKISIHE